MGKPEKKLQDKAIAYLKENKIYYINQFGDGFTGKGKPDLITCINGKFVAFELKVGKNDLQDDQVIHKRRIEKSNGLHFSPYTIDDFIEIVERLKHGYER
jgi:hypothetical protein